MARDRQSNKHIVLTSHPPANRRHRSKVNWGAGDPKERGPVIGSLTSPGDRNVIGAHAGAYALYR
ncbi:MAG: GTP cyclohydrolase II, partial [Planctomycetota bacterium]